MKTKGKKICDHKMIHLLMAPPRVRACTKCFKYWPKEHPKLTHEEMLLVIEFAIYVSEQAQKKGKKDPYEIPDVDLL